MSDPYSYTDPQNHRMQVLTTVGASGRPYVWLEADNLAIGGATVSVWLPLAEARELADQLDNQTASGYVDHTGDTLAVEPADDWTRFTFTHVEAYDDDQSRTVPVVVLTARLPEVATALRVAADKAKTGARTGQPRAADVVAAIRGGIVERPAAEPTHEGPDPSHGGLTTHRGTREQCSGPDCGPVEEPISRAHVVDYDAQTAAPECVDDCPGCGLIDPSGEHDGTCEVAAEEQPAPVECHECNDTGACAGGPCAIVPQPTAPALSDSVRQFLTFALDQAAEEMSLRDGFTADDEAALATLRRLADGTPTPRTERDYWQAIADALNAANDADMPVGIDLDGVLTDHNDHAVVWDFDAERWKVTGYQDDEGDEPAPATPAVGQRYTSRTHPDRTVTINRVWTAADGHTAVAYEWRDDKPGQCSSACPLDVFHRAYRPEQP